MKKLLIICGPNGAGKTKLAVYLSKLFNGQIISADSRQVYKYMDIGTGKDLPVNSKSEARNSKILGYDLVRPDQEFSVKKYADFAFKTIKETYKEGKLPVLVGGTGLYISSVVKDLDRIYVPRDLKLRKELEGKSAGELFEMLLRKDANFAERLNESDRKNSRRLIRALEVVSSNEVGDLKEEPIKFDSVLWIGLKADMKGLEERIEKRVEERIRMGFEKEIELLKRKGYWDGVAKATLGYKDWPDTDKWKKGEVNYAKRQMVWFKKEKNINWFDVGESGWEEKVVELVKKWYSTCK